MAIVPNPAVASNAAYAVPKHPAPIELKLDANEGAPPPADVLAALASAEVLRRYPDARALEATLAARLGVPPDHVVVTCGADDALDRACRALLGPGRALVLPVPTFEMLPRYAAVVGAPIREVSWPNGPYPVEAVLAAVDADTAAIALVTPNNPTGAPITRDDLAYVARAAPDVALFVDLAYAEFADDDLTDLALTIPNAIVFRTLSKAWGLAGLRVGYAVARPELVRWIRAAGGPYAVTTPSVALAAAWLERGEATMRAGVAQVRSERERLRGVLERCGAEAHPSQANFVLARPRDPVWLRDGLAGLGIAVRIWPGHPRLDGLVRITCPSNEEHYARLEAAIEATLAPEALLFDVDGVLVDVTRSYRRAIEETARSFGVSVSHEDIARAKAAGDANNDWHLTHRLVREGGVNAPFEEVKARFEALYHGVDGAPGFSAEERLLLDPALLERLAAMRPLALVTGRPRRDAEEFVTRHGLERLFGAVVCMEDAPVKPDPAPVRAALDRLGVRAAWMVGDTPDDVRAARGAGVVPLGFGGRSLSEAGAARVLETLQELEVLLP